MADEAMGRQQRERTRSHGDRRHSGEESRPSFPIHQCAGRTIEHQTSNTPDRHDKADTFRRPTC
jgi:hypothetical protein